MAMTKEQQIRLLQIGLPALCVLLAVLLFAPIFPATGAGSGRMGGAAAIYGFFAGDRQGWDSEGYLSDLVTLPGAGELKPGATIRGAGAQSLWAAVAQQMKKASAKGGKDANGEAVGGGGAADDQSPGGGSGSGGGGSGAGGGYTAADVVSYTITSVVKHSSTSATVYGTATMRDGNVVSGSVHCVKVNGQWQVG